jgi:hypothetical protein
MNAVDQKSWIIKTFIAAVCVLASCTAQKGAANGEIENSLLWKVSGNGLSRPSYIFGTIHQICEDDITVDNSLSGVFSLVDIIYLEALEPDPIQDIKNLPVNKRQLSLSKLIGKSAFAFTGHHQQYRFTDRRRQFERNVAGSSGSDVRWCGTPWRRNGPHTTSA